MEVPAGSMAVYLLLSCFVATSYGVYFSSLNETLIVTATHAKDQGGGGANHSDMEIQPDLQSRYRLGLQDRKSQTLLCTH
uniref:Uncharacterized protein n=1 Tax=Helianthus annuus TaxID=4232 RepID=A0A251RWZ7_HELAN